ncbi:MAG: hypothetical protein V3U03_03895 [Myxococcota bacterium]
MEKEPQKIRLALSPQAGRYARPDAPLEARLMAAGGALPLPPVELATVLFALMHDPEAEVKAKARESLESLPESVCAVVLSGAAHPAVLSHLARAFEKDEARLEKLALNPATDDATVAFLATTHFRRVIDIVSNNQERLLRYPEIVEALGSNPLTGRSTIDRILSFLDVERGGVDVDVPAAPEQVSEADAAAALRAVLGDEFGELASSLTVESTEEGEPSEEDEARSKSLYAIIQKMTVFQKIKLARLGNREARGLLVRDRNKIIAVAAVSSPKVTETEIVAFAQSRSVSDDILRIISRNRDWTRNYQVKFALATNPKSPQATAMKFVNYLQERDLYQIMRSRDVPGAVSAHARRILMKKGKV